MKRSLSGEQLLELLKQAAYPQSLAQLADIAGRKGWLSDNYQASQIKRALDSLEEKQLIHSVSRGELIEYSLRVAGASDDLLEKELNEPLVNWLSQKLGIIARALPIGPGDQKKGRGSRHWAYPDVVGYNNFRKGYDPLVRGIAEKTGRGFVDLYSFELKRALKANDARKAIQECASNSAWANYRYVVAPSHEPDARPEFDTLGVKLGVGLILLEIVRDNNGINFLPGSRIEMESPRHEVDLRLIQRIVVDYEWSAFAEWLRAVVDA